MSNSVIAGVVGLGALGAVLRAAVQGFTLKRERIPFIAGTLIVNFTGAFLLGVLHGAGANSTLVRLSGAGFLGAFTTFSGWMLEAERLNGISRRFAAAYLVVPLVIGLVLVWLGYLLGQVL